MSDSPFSGLDTLVIGVDALCPAVLSRLDPETAPTINDLLESGASGPLESQLPPWTPSAWPSIYTGVNPGKHGVFGFLRFDGYEWDIVNATDVREHAIWELLSDHGERSVVVNVPVTDPPESFDGALIPGYTAPADPDCHPEGILKEVREAIGGYRLYTDELADGATRDERVDGYELLTEMRGEAFRYLLERERPSFGFLQFQQSDTVFHEFPEDDDATNRVYAAIDAQIAKTLTEHDPDTVVLVSDHGIGPNDGIEFRPNTLFRDRGIATTSASADKPSWSHLAKQQRRNGQSASVSGDVSEDVRSNGAGASADVASADVASATESDGPSVPERAISAAASVGITSQRIGKVLERLGLDEAVLRIVPSDLVRAGSEHVDFPASRAYMRDRIEMGIRINLEGREPDGVVSRAEYDRFRSELIDLLDGLRTPDGDPVFDDVLPREAVFSGPYAENAPDIVTVPADFGVYLSSSVLDEPFGPPREPWSHTLYGMIAVVGDGIPETTLTGAHLLDVAPTVLSLLDVPVSDRMDGSAIPVVEPTERTEYPPYDGDERGTNDEAVADRLANLGYLE